MAVKKKVPASRTKNTAKPATARTRKKPQATRRPTAKHNPAQEQFDLVQRPQHYTTGAIEVIDAIDDTLTVEEFVGYCKGNTIKYVFREKHKGGTQDLEKAAWYLNRAIKKRKEQGNETK